MLTVSLKAIVLDGSALVHQLIELETHVGSDAWHR